MQWTVVACLSYGIFVCVAGCAHERQSAETLDGATHNFEIHWPPIAPDAARVAKDPPLLLGEVLIREAVWSDQNSALEITLVIRRPSNEAARDFWNSQLAFSEVPWMDEVRVWDAASRWQWPNLPFLLRRHGEERVERYGGIDPGKLVDNDFAAVLIRKYDADGKVEGPDTVNSPLVSAEWLADPDETTDIHTVVHVAKSDTFTVRTGTVDTHETGMLKIWLIYADFLGSRSPRTWPKEPEWAGGILMYGEIVWQKPAGESCRGKVRFMTPPEPTRFDWEQWSDDREAPAKARLSTQD